jgi:hypothetical protein
MEKLSKYKTQIFNIITIFLILEFVIYPGLTQANTIANILAGVGLLLLIVWGGLALYQYVTSDKGGIVDKNELKEAEQMVKEKPKKSNPKQFDGVKSDEPFVKTRTKPKTEKVMGEYQINNKEKVRKSVTKKPKQ